MTGQKCVIFSAFVTRRMKITAGLNILILAALVWTAAAAPQMACTASTLMRPVRTNIVRMLTAVSDTVAEPTRAIVHGLLMRPQ